MDYRTFELQNSFPHQTSSARQSSSYRAVGTLAVHHSHPQKTSVVVLEVRPFAEQTWADENPGPDVPNRDETGPDEKILAAKTQPRHLAQKLDAHQKEPHPYVA